MQFAGFHHVEAFIESKPAHQIKREPLHYVVHYDRLGAHLSYSLLQDRDLP